MRGPAVLVSLTALLIFVGPRAAGAAPTSFCPQCVDTGVSTSPDGWDLIGLVTGTGSSPHSPGTGAAGARSPSRAARPTGPLIEYDYRSTCDLPGGNGGCEGGTLQCLAQDTQSLFVAQRQVTPTVGAWSLQPGSVCLTPQQQLPYSPAQLQAFVDSYFQRLPLPLPALRLHPGDRAVVNLPLVASTDPPQQTTFSVTQAPFPPITITAAVSWRWSW